MRTKFDAAAEDKPKAKTAKPVNLKQLEGQDKMSLAELEEEFLVCILAGYMAPYLLPVVLTEFHVCNVHDLMQCLSLLPYPLVASLLITSLNALGHFK